MLGGMLGKGWLRGLVCLRRGFMGRGCAVFAAAALFIFGLFSLALWSFYARFFGERKARGA